uniref:Aminotransferase class I/classII large domain-containing protein n=1 Tax=Timema genevievae TaxID=629358 RepID=A0A7R9PIC1_TIMGE|nr:unnamed protein product [Timema genevievae]
MTPGPGKTKWNVPASEIARNTNNPIRNIVENLRLDPNPDKPLIALSIASLVQSQTQFLDSLTDTITDIVSRQNSLIQSQTQFLNSLTGTITDTVLQQPHWYNHRHSSSTASLIQSQTQFLKSLNDTITDMFGNLLPSPEVLDAVRESLGSLRYNGYAPSVGYIEAREAVARYSSSVDVTVDPKDVLLCSGCSGALDLCITALANPGQNILVPRPGFSIYRTLAEGLGIKVKSYNLKPERGWMVDLDHLEEQCDEKTAAIIINNPSNPCGSVFSREHLFDILEVARRNFLPIIADEIYEHMVFPGKEFHSLGSLSLEVPVLSCSGLTKRLVFNSFNVITDHDRQEVSPQLFLIPGWRMGWIIIHDRNGVFDQEVRKGLQRLSQRIIGSNTLVQGALPAILKNTPQEFYYNTLCILQNNALVAFEMLKNIEGLRPVMPEGAMYIMVGISMEHFPEFSSELHFLEQMVTEESVFCLPGQLANTPVMLSQTTEDGEIECFDYPGYMRLVLSVPEEQLREACHRIANYCARHFTINSISSYLVQHKHSLP